MTGRCRRWSDVTDGNGRKKPPTGIFCGASILAAACSRRHATAAQHEVLLACIIEDEPKEQYRSDLGLEGELGIEFDNDSYPTAPWKSQFFAFLQIDSDTALNYLQQLVNFSTDRWVHGARKRSGSDPRTLSLRLPDGTVREYAGNHWVFNWSHQNTHFIGQLNCALAALEWWLCGLIDAGIDVGRLWDAAFDRALVTFDDQGRPEFSRKLSEHARTELRWRSCIPLTDEHRRRLVRHRERARSQS